MVFRFFCFSSESTLTSQNSRANKSREDCQGDKTKHPGSLQCLGPSLSHLLRRMLLVHLSSPGQSARLSALWVTVGGVVKL